MNPPKLDVAYHEAGHAVVAIIYGLKIKNVSLKNTNEYHGITSLEPFERQGTLEHANREIRLNLAGFVGEGLFSDNTIKINPPNHPELLDSIGVVRNLLDSNESFRRLANGLSVSSPSALTMIKDPTIRVYINYILDSCFEKLIPLKPVIKLIAEELYKKEELSGDEVSSHFNSFMQSSAVTDQVTTV
jgi:ATP-dependent Zn protease